LGAQDEEWAPILGFGAAFTAHKQFLTNTEAAITQAGETPVAKYQSVLQYARGKLDFVLGEQLYMCLYDMMLASLAKRITGYNNEILVATAAASPGTNQTLNTEKQKPRTEGAMRSDIDRPPIPMSQFAKQADSQRHVAASRSMLQSNSHEDTKTLLTVAVIGVGIIYYLSR